MRQAAVKSHAERLGGNGSVCLGPEIKWGEERASCSPVSPPGRCSGGVRVWAPLRARTSVAEQDQNPGVPSAAFAALPPAGLPAVSRAHRGRASLLVSTGAVRGALFERLLPLPPGCSSREPDKGSSGGRRAVPRCPRGVQLVCFGQTLSASE